MIKLVYYANNVEYYLENVAENIRWSGDIKQAPRKLDVDLINVKESWNEIDVKIENGKEIRFYYNDVELFRGVIFEVSIDHLGKQKITAFDELKYLTTNSEPRVFKNQKASSIVSMLCKDVGVPTASIKDTGYVIKKMIASGTIWDEFQRALSYTKEKTQRKYWIYSREGKLSLKEKTDDVVRWVIESGGNMENASRRINIENLRNSIKVIAGDIEKSPKITISKDDKSIAKYGKMQAVETVDEKEKRAKEIADRKLKELNKPEDEISVTAIGNVEVVSGKGVYAYDKMTALSGGYYVTQDTHTFDSSGKHMMDITLSVDEDVQFDPLSLDEIDELSDVKKK